MNDGEFVSNFYIPTVVSRFISDVMVIFEFGVMFVQLLWGSLLFARFRKKVTLGFYLGCFADVLASLEYIF